MAPKKRPARRRPKGLGTVYPVRNRRKEVIAYYAEIVIDGATVRRRAATAEAAEVALGELRRLKAAEVSPDDATQTLETWLGVWYAYIVRHGKRNGDPHKPRSLADYRRMIEGYIAPMIGDVPLDRVRQDTVQTFVTAVRDGIRANTADDGAATARRCALVLKMALDLAVVRELIPRSPYHDIRLPRLRPRKVEPPTPEQVAAFLDVAASDRHAALWHIYALMGLRLGEGAGLRWADYDPAARTLRVEQQVQRRERVGDEAGGLTLGAPKSDAGERVLPAPAAVCALLDAHRAAQLVGRVKRADTWTDHGLIFANRDGGPLWPRHVEERWRTLWTRAGGPAEHTLHDLRRAVATMLDEADATETIKAGILGHTKATITQRYVTARVEAMRRVLEAVAARVLRRAA